VNPDGAGADWRFQERASHLPRLPGRAVLINRTHTQRKRLHREARVKRFTHG
jgi:hypothetical protein